MFDESSWRSINRRCLEEVLSVQDMLCQLLPRGRGSPGRKIVVLPRWTSCARRPAGFVTSCIAASCRAEISRRQRG